MYRIGRSLRAVSYTHLRAHETVLDLVCRLLLEKKKTIQLLPPQTPLFHTHPPCPTLPSTSLSYHDPLPSHPTPLSRGS
ncbi:hypothetical protein PVA38_11065 [Streptococcus pneumoniae D39]|nr:hypothetical protein PVA38_11065 [Streptococcus pneumoniae D39]